MFHAFQSGRHRPGFRLQMALSLLLTVAASPYAAAQSVEPSSRAIQQLLAKHCFPCHGPDEEARQTEWRLDSSVGLFQQIEGGRLVVPGMPEDSLLWQRIRSDDPTTRMPPEDFPHPLPPADIDRIEAWIAEGAPWRDHWAFTLPRRPVLPFVEDIEWTRSPVDYFVLAKLEALGRRPSGEADRRTLIRRVTLDLTGLPPTPAEVSAFVSDPAPDAYERLVDRLLASPRYGERMAVEWLDAARFADTHGYLFDTERTMWPWRDWVIDALNTNVPFDQFAIEQLAGDLLPDATRDQRIATGFLRNHIINNEAGAIPEEYYVENVVDRVDTVSTVWMGLTLQCCRCHDHKSDPFTQEEYYRLYAYFNNVPELGLDGINGNAQPFLPAPSAEHERTLEDLSTRVAAAEARLESLGEEIEAKQREWEASAPAAAPEICGLRARWPLDDNATESLTPESVSVVEAATPEYEEGLLGSALAVQGLGYVNAADRYRFVRDRPFTVAVWLKPSSAEGRLTLLSQMADADELYRGLAIQLVEGVPALYLVHRFPDDMIQVQLKDALDVNRWHHLAATYDGSGKAAGVTLYVDGQALEPGITVDTLSEPIANSSPLWIGNGHPAAKYKGLLDDVRIYDRELASEEISHLPGLDIGSLLAVAPDERNDEQSRRIRDHYLESVAPPAWREQFRELEALRSERDALRQDVPTVMVMSERPERRETRILERGAYDAPREVVEPGVPAVLPPMLDELPANRLGLAKWLASPDHPLTARVAVNRTWQTFFGAGLVFSSEDFGVMGTPPSHPELLDWLATEFVDTGWDVKALHRRIVTSATYRQASRATPEQLAWDPANRMLARGARFRLPAEVIRDQALATSGLLVSNIGGPSVKPYQPEGLWREVAFDFSGAVLTAQVYEPDDGAGLYRRSLYTFWKRTAPPPAMLILDAPDRERCVMRRVRTNTPLQALLLMNEPAYVEAARRIAERMMREGGPETSDRIRYGFQLVTARPPLRHELDLLTALAERQESRFARDGEAAAALLQVGEAAVDDELPAHQLAALTVVASVLLNLDETVTHH